MTGSRSSSRGATPGSPDDDLPGFLAWPPGTPRPAPDEGAGALRPRRRGRVLAATAATVPVVGAVVAAMVLGSRQPPAARAMGPGDVRAHLVAGGVVLAQAPAGVTAGFPTVSLTTRGDRAALHLDLLVANCLTPTAPARPEDAGCRPVGRESGDLAGPALRTVADGSRLVLTGHVPTSLRRDGAAPVPTGRALDVTVTVDLPAPSGDAPLPAAGSVTVGGRTAATLPGDARTTVGYGP